MVLTSRSRLLSVVALAIAVCALAGCGALPLKRLGAAATATSAPMVAPATATPTTAVAPAIAAAPAVPASPIAGAWQLQRFEYMSGKAVTVAQPASYTLEFLSDGTLRVRAGCNTGAGTYKTNEDRLAIENLALTEKACAEGSLGGQFVQGLNNGVSWVLADGELNINMRYDAGGMVFARPR